MQYVTESGKKYGVSYQELREEYHRYRSMTDSQFLKNLVPALHFAIFVSWYKELGMHVLADEGIVHELAHLLHIGKDPIIMNKLREIRRSFDDQLELK